MAAEMSDHESSSTAAADETPEDSYIWTELRLLQSIVVQSRLGQNVLRFADNFLWTVEKCAEWSLPTQEITEGAIYKSVNKSELVRPLPWILFLPSLVVLRTIRMSLNIGAFVTGYSKVTPSGVVKFVQISRRHLNSLKSAETKGKRGSKDQRSSMSEAKRALIRSIRLTLSSLSCLDTSKPSLSPPPTKIHVSSVLDLDAEMTTSEEKSMTESMDSTIKRRGSMSSNESAQEEEEEEKETLQEKIDRLALQSSEEDEDFDPADCNVSSNGSSSEDVDDDDDNDKSCTFVSSNELYDIIEDSKNETEKFQAAERAAAQDSEQKSPAKESRDTVDGSPPSSRRIHSPECYTPDRSSQEGEPIFYSPISSDSDTPTKEGAEPSAATIAEKPVIRDSVKTSEFINGEAHFISASTVSESKSSEKTNNGTVMEKRNANVSKCHKGKRTSHGNRRKK